MLTTNQMIWGGVAIAVVIVLVIVIVIVIKRRNAANATVEGYQFLPIEMEEDPKHAESPVLVARPMIGVQTRDRRSLEADPVRGDIHITMFPEVPLVEHSKFASEDALRKGLFEKS